MVAFSGGECCVACDAPLLRGIPKDPYRYFICGSCGTASMRPMPSDQEIVDHYRRKFESGNYELLRRYSR